MEGLWRHAFLGYLSNWHLKLMYLHKGNIAPLNLGTLNSYNSIGDNEKITYLLELLQIIFYLK